MSKPRMDSPVRVKNAKGVNKRYNGELGLVFNIKTEGRHTYYMVRLNGGHEIALGSDELEVLRNR